MKTQLQHHLPSGTVLSDRYQITGFLGQGGFAAVFEGKDLVLERTIAIKVLDINKLAAGTGDAAMFLERFKREAKMAARISHNNVVSIYDYKALEDFPFIAMERLEGHDFDQELKTNGGMNPVRLWPLFCRSLDALAKGHDLGIVHKDLKPANIFLIHPGTRDEDVRLLDFGIARMMDDDASLTNTGRVYGTARYFAPEYIQDKDNVSPALDIYQMGLILIETLTGLPVVMGDNGLACVYKHSMGTLDIPAALLDGPLAPVIIKALALDPLDRYQDMRQFKDEMEAIDPRLIPKLPPSPQTRPLNAVSSNARVVVRPEEAPDTSEHSPPSTLGVQAAPRASEPGQRARVRAAGVPAAHNQQQMVVIGQQEVPDTANTKPLELSGEHFAGPVPPERPAKKKTISVPLIVTGLLGVLLLVVSLIAGAIIIPALLAPDDKPVTPASGSPIVVEKEADAEGSEALEPEVVATENDAGSGGAADEVEVPAAVTVVVEVRSRPSGATVLDEGKQIGRTPFEVAFEADEAAPKTLWLSRAGFKNKKITVKPGDAPRKAFRLFAKSPPPKKEPSGGTLFSPKKKPSGGGLIPK